jgi:hypothetical protein
MNIEILESFGIHVTEYQRHSYNPTTRVQKRSYVCLIMKERWFNHLKPHLWKSNIRYIVQSNKNNNYNALKWKGTIWVTRRDDEGFVKLDLLADTITIGDDTVHCAMWYYRFLPETNLFSSDLNVDALLVAILRGTPLYWYRQYLRVACMNLMSMCGKVI